MTYDGNRSSIRIALLTPYHGNNLGDASIQDAMIANLRVRLPGIEFFGISLNSENFIDQHGAGAFPLTTGEGMWYKMTRRIYTKEGSDEGRAQVSPEGRSGCVRRIKNTLKSVPVLRQALMAGVRIWRELHHTATGYFFLRRQDLLIVSGGGQLNEQYGGAWGQPFALFKFAVLAHLARVPYAIVSVGVGRIESPASKLFISTALRLACYRSYRERNTLRFATTLVRKASADVVAPDLAFSLLSSQLPPATDLRAAGQFRSVIAVSPIAFAKPRNWPTEDSALHQRYVQQMAVLVSELLVRGYLLVFVCSSLNDDETVLPELVDHISHIDPESRKRLAEQSRTPRITTWRDFVAALRGVDFVIASRLHSTILGFVSEIPTIAISSDPKVDWVMEDVGQTEYLLHFRDFTSGDVIAALARLEVRREEVVREISTYRERMRPVMEGQYDALAGLAAAGRQGYDRHNHTPQIDTSGHCRNLDL